MSTETRNPDDLSPLPAIEAMPRWSSDAPEWFAFVADIERNGIQHPIQITEDGLVVDGWTRRQAALAAGLESVPVRIVPNGEVYEVVMREIRRRHMTKGATAYCAFPFLQDAFLEAIKKGYDNRTRKPKNDETPMISRGVLSTPQNKSVEELAESIGVSESLLHQAATVWKIFDEDPDYKLTMERQILSGEAGLGAVIAGYAGRTSTRGQARPDTKHWLLLTKSMRSWHAWPRYWGRLDSDEKDRVNDEMRQGVAAMPAEARHMLVMAIKWAEKQERERAETEAA